MTSRDLPPLGGGFVHVWRIPLSDVASADDLRLHLSPAECARADRLLTADLRARFTVAHAWLRLILGAYVGAPPAAIEFDVSPAGKPSLARAARDIEFNLSHSGDLALVAVSAGSRVGIDVERRNPGIEALRVADRFFSDHERASLREATEPGALIRGFFAAWTRKEAYVKARGETISRGLHHFDVSLAPGRGAQLIADRLDATAPDRWAIVDLDVGDGYSAALVHDGPVPTVISLGLSDFPIAQRSR